MKAKYYIYKNLHTNTFSVRYKGKVIDHPVSIVANDVLFYVSKLGRERVVSSNRKNVHAYIVCSSYSTNPNSIPSNTNIVYYNPYTTEHFTICDVPIYKCDTVYMVDCKYVLVKV